MANSVVAHMDSGPESAEAPKEVVGCAVNKVPHGSRIEPLGSSRGSDDAPTGWQRISAILCARSSMRL